MPLFYIHNIMLKSDLIEIISQHLPNLSKEDSTKSVNLIIELMTQSLSTPGRVEIRGFGSFAVRYHEPREARNPKSGEKVRTKGKYYAHFKPGKELRERVNKPTRIA